jgi:hypothetical protein
MRSRHVLQQIVFTLADHEREKSLLGLLEGGSLPLLRTTACGSRWRRLARLGGVDPARQQLHCDVVDRDILPASHALILASCHDACLLRPVLFCGV